MPWWFAAISFVFFLVLFLIIAKVRASLSRIRQSPGFPANNPTPVKPSAAAVSRPEPGPSPNKPMADDPFSTDMSQFSTGEFDKNK